MNNHRRHTELPVIPKPQHKEVPVTEELTSPGPHRDVRPQVIKPFDTVNVPNLNKLYGTLRADNSWQWIIDNYAKGGITTVQSTLVSATVTPALSQVETRLSRWPGAISMYLVIRSFSLAASTATFATAGSLDIYYQDLIGGQVIPLGSTVNNDELNLNNINILIPTPITDPGAFSQAIGNVQVTLSSAGTVGTYIWQIAFSYAYLLPTTKPYEIQHMEDLLDAHPGHVGTR